MKDPIPAGYFQAGGTVGFRRKTPEVGGGGAAATAVGRDYGSPAQNPVPNVPQAVPPTQGGSSYTGTSDSVTTQPSGIWDNDSGYNASYDQSRTGLGQYGEEQQAGHTIGNAEYKDEHGFSKNYDKPKFSFGSALAGGAGTLIGNALLPGIGGTIGSQVGKFAYKSTQEDDEITALAKQMDSASAIDTTNPAYVSAKDQKAAPGPAGIQHVPGAGSSETMHGGTETSGYGGHDYSINSGGTETSFQEDDNWETTSGGVDYSANTGSNWDPSAFSSSYDSGSSSDDSSSDSGGK